MERAVNYYYEHGIPSEEKISNLRFPEKNSFGSCASEDVARLPITVQISDNAWLIGRRIALGYTLNSGIALRNHSLRFKFEGQLLEKSKSSFLRSKTKEKFSASNLLFESATDSPVLISSLIVICTGSSVNRKTLESLV